MTKLISNQQEHFPKGILFLLFVIQIVSCNSNYELIKTVNFTINQQIHGCKIKLKKKLLKR